jgi:hypothetical protein
MKQPEIRSSIAILPHKVGEFLTIVGYDANVEGKLSMMIIDLYFQYKEGKNALPSL